MLKLSNGSVLVSSLLAAHIAFANTGDDISPVDKSERGREIAQTVDSNDAGFEDYVVVGKMTVNRPGGISATREFEMNTLELRDDGDKRLVSFSKPRDLAGFVSLTHTHPSAPDDQWIFLPATHRAKRLASRDKTGSFAGSEFAYEDIATWELSNYDYEFIKDELCGEPATTCHTIANIPKYTYSGYEKLVETIDPRIWQPVQIVYFDRQGRELKRLEFFDYKQFQGKHWRPGRIVMTNAHDGSKSEIIWENYRFKTGLRESDLTESRLEYWSR